MVLYNGFYFGPTYIRILYIFYEEYSCFELVCLKADYGNLLDLLEIQLRNVGVGECFEKKEAKKPRHKMKLLKSMRKKHRGTKTYKRNSSFFSQQSSGLTSKSLLYCAYNVPH